MKEVIILVVFAAIFAALASICRNSGEQKQQLRSANGIIDSISHYDGTIIYYVSFREEGKTFRGKSIPYPSSTKRLCVGDEVKINYYETKAGWPRVIIIDEDMEPCENSLKLLSKVFKWISVGFFVVALIFLIKTIF